MILPGAAQRPEGVLRGIAFWCLWGGVAMVISLHAIQRSVSPIHHYVSEYANASPGWGLSIALLAIAIGSAALGLALWRAIGARLGPALLVVTGPCLALSAGFSTGRVGGEVEFARLSERLHGLASVIAFALLVLAMLTLARPFAQDRRWGAMGRASAPLAVAAVAIAGASYVAVPDAAGLRQRGFLLPVFAWLLGVVTRFRRLAEREEPELPERSGSTA